MNNKTSRWWDIFAVVLLILALSVAAFRLRITGWTANLGIIEGLVMLGTIFGLALGISAFPQWLARLFGLGYTFFFIPLELGLFMEKDAVEWLDKVSNLYARLYYSIRDFFTNTPVTDPLLFLSLVALIFWFMAMFAGYRLTRDGKPWAPLIIVGLALLIVDFYTPFTENRDRYSGLYVFLVLVLVARMHFLRSRAEWNQKGTVFDPEIGFDMGRTVVISGLVLVFIAWSVPNFVEALTPGTELQRRLAESWETLRGRLQNAVAGLQSPAVAISDYFGNDLNLGVGGTRDEEPVFTVDIGNTPSTGIRFYWKARSYDSYDNALWTSKGEKLQSISANEWPFIYPPWEGRKTIDVSITSVKGSVRNIYAPALITAVGRSADVYGSLEADGTLDLSGLLAVFPLKAGEYVKVRSWVSVPTVEQLVNAAAEFPAEIRNTYLQLPQRFNRRIRNLALQITADQDTQYEKVMAITRWLRTNITYSESIDPIPPGREPIDWFLFDYKKGFCNYYATSEVLMLRSIGIPARLSAGYAEGEYDEGKHTFTIRRRDSHAWPEVYFTGYGWVEFEPTSSQPVTNLLEKTPEETVATPETSPNSGVDLGEDPTGENRAEELLNAEEIAAANRQNTISIVAISGSLSVGALIIIFLYRRGKLNFLMRPVPVLIENNLDRRGWETPSWVRQWARMTEMTPMQRLYARLNWVLLLLGRKTNPGQTPAEKMAALTEVLPSAHENISSFLFEYQRAEYSQHAFNYNLASASNGQIWRKAIRSWFRRIFSEPG